MENFIDLSNYIEKRSLKYSIVTYGCQMNEHESEKLRGILEKIGYVIADNIECADFIIFNTCCVRESAEHKTFGNVGALKARKKENPNLVIAVCGCMTQQEDVAKKLYTQFPFVDIVIGTHNMHNLAFMINTKIISKKRVLEVENHEGCIKEDVPVVRETGALASVNIMYGCNNFCSYCIVPYVRGRERSRVANTIISEISQLASDGYSEVTLLGQNVNSYNGDGSDGFAGLLERICNETEMSRIRFMTSHPKDLSDELIYVISKNQKLCKHIHLPVQSGSSSILSVMNRGYSREKYIDTISKIRSSMPDIVITTDVIVGFPGETEKDFEDTLSLVEKIRFDAAFTFVYSKRSGTKAATMNFQIEKETKAKRISRLIELQNKITEEKNNCFVGRIENVLAEGISTRDKSHLCGRTDGGKMVNFEGSSEFVGNFCKVKITEGKRTTLFGRIT